MKLKFLISLQVLLLPIFMVNCENKDSLSLQILQTKNKIKNIEQALHLNSKKSKRGLSSLNDENKIDKLETTFDDRFTELNNELNDLHKTLSIILSQKTKSEDKFNTKLSNIQSQLNEKDQSVNDLDVKISENSQKYEDLDKKLKSQVDKNEQSVNRLELKLIESSQKYDDLSQNFKVQLNENNKSLSNLETKINEKNDELIRSFEKIKLKINQNEQSMNDIEVKLSNSSKIYADLEKNLKSGLNEESMRKLESKLNESSLILEDLEFKLKNDVNDNQQNVKKLESNIIEYSKIIDGLNHNFEKLKSQIDDNDHNLKKLESNLIFDSNGFEELSITMKSEFDKNKETISKLESKLDEKLEELDEKLKKEKNLNEESVNKLDSKIDQKLSQLESNIFENLDKKIHILSRFVTRQPFKYAKTSLIVLNTFFYTTKNNADECWAQCQNDAKCIAITFDSNSLRCFLFFINDFLTYQAGSDGWTTYSLKKITGLKEYAPNYEYNCSKNNLCWTYCNSGYGYCYTNRSCSSKSDCKVIDNCSTSCTTYTS